MAVQYGTRQPRRKQADAVQGTDKILARAASLQLAILPYLWLGLSRLHTSRRAADEALEYGIEFGFIDGDILIHLGRIPL